TLVHLKHAGVWDKICGMVIGKVHNITGDSPPEESAYDAREVNAFLKDFFCSYTFPCIKTEFFGHKGGSVRTQISLPVGGLATITASELRLSFPDGLKTEQVKRLKDLELENSRLRKAVSDLTLDKLILQEAARGNL